MRGPLIKVLLTLLISNLVMAASDVVIDIHEPGDKRIKIAIPPFLSMNGSTEHASGALMAKVLTDDLEFSDYFDIVDEWHYPTGYNSKGKGLPNLSSWKGSGAEALAHGSYELSNLELTLEGRLFDLGISRQVMGKKYKAKKGLARRMAHYLSDEIVLQYTGKRGIASTYLIFTSNLTSAKGKELYIMDYDGKNPRRLTKNGSLNLFPKWSPDGRYVAFTTFKHGYPSIYLMDLRNGKSEKLTSFPGINIANCFSPDGGKLLMSLSKDGNSEIYLLGLAEKKLKRLTHHPAIDTSACFSPNGREIVFTSDRSGSPQIYVMDSEGSNLRRLTHHGSYNSSASWSPSGDRIAYVNQRGKNNDIWLMNADGRESYPLISDFYSNENPSWSPDGRFLAFSSTRDGKTNIFVMKADGSRQKRLSFIGGDNSNPVWSPYLYERR